MSGDKAIKESRMWSSQTNDEIRVKGMYQMCNTPFYYLCEVLMVAQDPDVQKNRVPIKLNIMSDIYLICVCHRTIWIGFI